MAYNHLALFFGLASLRRRMKKMRTATKAAAAAAAVVKSMKKAQIKVPTKAQI